MVYRLDEYSKAFPKKPIGILKKFKDYPINLHEMSTDEVNTIIATWDGVTIETATNNKSQIKLYLNWLTDNGVITNINPNNLIFPIKTPEFFIYSNNEIHEYWNIFLTSCEHKAARTGEFHSRAKYLASYVSNILSFYGLTIKQILELDLSDVQSYGIINYNLPLTQEDIDVLLEYKNLKEFANNKKVTGTKYIRSAGVVTEDTLDYGIAHGNCEDNYKYLKRVLTCRNMYKLGRYAEIYAEEKRTGELVDLSNRAVPDKWFLKKIELIVGNELKTNRITIYKKNYNAYRTERLKYDAQFNVDKSFECTKLNTSEVTNTKKLYDLIEYIKDAEHYYLNQKVSPLTSGKVSAVQDILLYIQHELNINVIK